MPPRMTADGTTKIGFLTSSIASLAAPTQAELRAAGMTDLSCHIPKDQWRIGVTGNAEITDPPLCTDVNVTDPGQPTYEAWAQFFRYTTTPEDIPWTLFTGKGMTGYLVVRIGVASATNWTTGDLVRVYEVIGGSKQQIRDFGTYHKFLQKWYVQSAAERATVA